MHVDRLTLDQEAAAAGVDPVAAQEYVRCTGWRLEPRLGRGITAVWERPESDLHQIQVPLTRDVSDFAVVMALAVAGIAAWERRPAAEVLDDLLAFPADLLRVRVAGGLSLGDAMALLETVQAAGPCRVVASLSPGWALTVACPVDRPRPAAAAMAALDHRACGDGNGQQAGHVEVYARWSRTLPPPDGVPECVVLRPEEVHALGAGRPAPAAIG